MEASITLFGRVIEGMTMGTFSMSLQQIILQELINICIFGDRLSGGTVEGDRESETEREDKVDIGAA